MKLSDCLEYRDYGRHYAHGDLKNARRSLHQCLKIKHIRDNLEQYTFILTLIGNLHFEQNRKYLSLQYYQKAINCNSQSLLLRYLFAKFLFERIKDPVAALEVCEVLIHTAINNPTMETEDDFDSQKYITMAGELRNAILSRRN